MKVYTVHARKGGCAKSTLVGNTAFLASTRGRCVAMVDNDSQGNLSSWFTEHRSPELVDVLTGKVAVEDALVLVADNLHLLPTDGLTGRLKRWGETELFQDPFAYIRLNRKLQEHGFEIVVYDLGPGMSQLERSVIMTCDEVVLPALGEYFSLDGVEQAAQELERIEERSERQVRSDKLVLSMVNRSFDRHRQSIEQYQVLAGARGYELFVVAQDSKIPNSQFMHEPLATYDPGNRRSLPELERLTDAILESA